MQKRLKIKHNLTILAAIEFLVGLRFYYPVAVLAFAEVAGDFMRAMSVYSVLMITQTILDVPLGILSDSKGRRFAVIGSYLSVFPATLCFALAFSFAHGLWWLYAGAAFMGLANAFFSGNNDALIYETLAHYGKEDAVASIMGRVTSMRQLAFALTGIVTMLLLKFGCTFESLMYLSLIPLGIACVLSFFTRAPPHRTLPSAPPHHHFWESLRLLVREPRLALVASASAWQVALSCTINTFIPSFIASVWPLWLTPFYRTLQHTVGSISFWFADRIVRRFGEIRVLLYSKPLSMVFSITAYALSSAAAPFLLVMSQFFYATTTTADGALQQKLFSDAQRSTMGSIISVASAILNAGMAIVAGAIADRIGASWTLIVLAVAALPQVLVYAKLARRAG